MGAIPPITDRSNTLNPSRPQGGPRQSRQPAECQQPGMVITGKLAPAVGGRAHIPGHAQYYVNVGETEE